MLYVSVNLSSPLSHNSMRAGIRPFMLVSVFWVQAPGSGRHWVSIRLTFTEWIKKKNYKPLSHKVHITSPFYICGNWVLKGKVRIPRGLMPGVATNPSFWLECLNSARPRQVCPFGPVSLGPCIVYHFFFFFSNWFGFLHWEMLREMAIQNSSSSMEIF